MTGLPAPVPLATPIRRLVGFVLDSFVYSGFVLAVWLYQGADFDAVARGEEELSTRVLLAALLLFGVYHVVLTATRGQTLGKMAMRTRVVDVDSGAPPGWQSAFIRWGAPGVLTAIPWLGFVAVAMYAWLLWDRRRQGLHDRLAQTLVIAV